MQKQERLINKLPVALCLMAFFLLGTPAQAQDNLEADDTEYQIDARGGQSWNYKEFKVPNNTSFSILRLTLRGADGGNRKYDDGMLIDFNKGGGEGATVKADFPIGTGPNEIAPGSTLRFLIGKRGATINAGASVGAGGGGGTGVFVKNASDVWTLLAVAGGGGGAMADCCTFRYAGKAAGIGENGRSGGDGQNPGANNGHNGNSSYIGLSQAGHGGGGIRSAWPGGLDDPTNEPTGGTRRGREFYQKFGCGQGGANETYAGGGGGYSGGGGGNLEGGGGGGGSYVNEDLASNIIKTQNGVAKSPIDGYVIYQFTNSTASPGKNLRLAEDQRMAIHLSYGETDNGTNIQLWSTGNQNATWLLENDKILLMKESNKCIDLSRGDISNGGNIQLWDCQNNNDNQEWIYDAIYKSIRLKVDPDHCIDLYHSDTHNGNNIQLWNCNNTIAQQWVIDELDYPVPERTDRAMTFRLLKNQDRCIDLYHSEAVHGTNIHLWNCNDTDAQIWIFDGNMIKIHMEQTKCLSVDGKQTENGTNIKLGNCNGQWHQKWIYDGVTNRFRLKKYPDKCLDLEGGEITRRTNIQLKDCNDSADQRWVITEPICLYDETPPTARCKDLSVTGTTYAVLPEAIDDNSTDNCELGEIRTNRTGVYGNAGDVKTVRLIVSDASGNTDSCISRITLEGNGN